eukprot:763327-Hanusia_phi.AAC.9
MADLTKNSLSVLERSIVQNFIDIAEESIFSAAGLKVSTRKEETEKAFHKNLHNLHTLAKRKLQLVVSLLLKWKKSFFDAVQTTVDDGLFNAHLQTIHDKKDVEYLSKIKSTLEQLGSTYDVVVIQGLGEDLIINVFATIIESFHGTNLDSQLIDEITDQIVVRCQKCDTEHENQIKVLSIICFYRLQSLVSKLRSAILTLQSSEKAEGMRLVRLFRSVSFNFSSEEHVFESVHALKVMTELCKTKSIKFKKKEFRQDLLLILSDCLKDFAGHQQMLSSSNKAWGVAIEELWSRCVAMKEKSKYTVNAVPLLASLLSALPAEKFDKRASELMMKDIFDVICSSKSAGTLGKVFGKGSSSCEMKLMALDSLWMVMCACSRQEKSKIPLSCQALNKIKENLHNISKGYSSISVLQATADFITLYGNSTSHENEKEMYRLSAKQDDLLSFLGCDWIFEIVALFLKGDSDQKIIGVFALQRICVLLSPLVEHEDKTRLWEWRRRWQAVCSSFQNLFTDILKELDSLVGSHAVCPLEQRTKKSSSHSSSASRSLASKGIISALACIPFLQTSMEEDELIAMLTRLSVNESASVRSHALAGLARLLLASLFETLQGAGDVSRAARRMKRVLESLAASCLEIFFCVPALFEERLSDLMVMLMHVNEFAGVPSLTASWEEDVLLDDLVDMLEAVGVTGMAHRSSEVRRLGMKVTWMTRSLFGGRKGGESAMDCVLACFQEGRDFRLKLRSISDLGKYAEEEHGKPREQEALRCLDAFCQDKSPQEMFAWSDLLCEVVSCLSCRKKLFAQYVGEVARNRFLELCREYETKKSGDEIASSFWSEWTCCAMMAIAGGDVGGGAGAGGGGGHFHLFDHKGGQRKGDVITQLAALLKEPLDDQASFMFEFVLGKSSGMEESAALTLSSIKMLDEPKMKKKAKTSVLLLRRLRLYSSLAAQMIRFPQIQDPRGQIERLLLLLQDSIGYLSTATDDKRAILLLPLCKFIIFAAPLLDLHASPSAWSPELRRKLFDFLCQLDPSRGLDGARIQLPHLFDISAGDGGVLLPKLWALSSLLAGPSFELSEESEKEVCGRRRGEEQEEGGTKRWINESLCHAAWLQQQCGKLALHHHLLGDPSGKQWSIRCVHLSSSWLSSCHFDVLASLVLAGKLSLPQEELIVSSVLMVGDEQESTRRFAAELLEKACEQLDPLARVALASSSSISRSETYGARVMSAEDRMELRKRASGHVANLCSFSDRWDMIRSVFTGFIAKLFQLQRMGKDEHVLQRTRALLLSLAAWASVLDLSTISDGADLLLTDFLLLFDGISDSLQQEKHNLWRALTAVPGNCRVCILLLLRILSSSTFDPHGNERVLKQVHSAASGICSSSGTEVLLLLCDLLRVAPHPLFSQAQLNPSLHVNAQILGKPAAAEDEEEEDGTEEEEMSRVKRSSVIILLAGVINKFARCRHEEWLQLRDRSAVLLHTCVCGLQDTSSSCLQSSCKLVLLSLVRILMRPPSPRSSTTNLFRILSSEEDRGSAGKEGAKEEETEGVQRLSAIESIALSVFEEKEGREGERESLGCLERILQAVGMSDGFSRLSDALSRFSSFESSLAFIDALRAPLASSIATVSGAGRNSFENEVTQMFVAMLSKGPKRMTRAAILLVSMFLKEGTFARASEQARTELGHALLEQTSGPYCQEADEALLELMGS